MSSLPVGDMVDFLISLSSVFLKNRSRYWAEIFSKCSLIISTLMLRVSLIYIERRWRSPKTRKYNPPCRWIFHNFFYLKYFVKTYRTKVVHFIKFYRTISRKRPTGLMTCLIFWGSKVSEMGEAEKCPNHREPLSGTPTAQIGEWEMIVQWSLTPHMFVWCTLQK